MSSFAFSALFLAIVIHACKSGELPYYGVPIGTIDHETLRIRASVFLADDHTIMFDKFHHSPHKSSCIAMMIGPPRNDDAKRKLGEGILLPYTQPNFSWEEIRRKRIRAKRSLDRTTKTKIVKNISGRLLKYGPVMNTATSTPNLSTTLPPQKLSSLNPNESYEEIEYLEDEEEMDEREESVKHLLPALKDGETHRSPPITTTTAETTTIVTTTVIFPTLVTASSGDKVVFSSNPEGTPIIVFDKSDKVQQRHETNEHASIFQNSHDDLTSNYIVETAAKADNYDTSFSLPPAQDEQVAFLLTNGGRLSDYKWIGLYDQCRNESVPLISLEGVDPPREEEIGPLIGLKRNISSRSIRILNCNTILVPGLHFEANQNLPNSFFFFGLGNITNVVQQTKARIIGYELGDPLEPFSGDDVMVRLPRGIRTFDVDFLSIYNEDEKETYGYASLPSLLVPPCVDEV